ncbi:hypothetical protein ACIBH1_36235 [Nonomuraea sp. NPDC050663]|uniref:hypothetical protein n=1 Tax=Nonomuraea sp. NPDC050663 TaxID=3364370 RepID=UPI0037A5ABAD
MAAIVVVHGIAQELKGEHLMRDQLLPALQDGVSHAGGSIDGTSVAFAAYGHLFRPPAEVLAPEPYYTAADVTEGYEQELLLALWKHGAQVDFRVVSPDDEVLVRTPVWARRALAALSRSRFLSGVAERAFIGALKQVRAYFGDLTVRAAAQESLAKLVDDDTRVVVAHSLGSVVAYEALAAHPEWPVKSLVTLGSPLGLPNLIFDRLTPAPTPGPPVRGAWPGAVEQWTNIADRGDIVAVVEDLRLAFGERVRQIRVHNGPHAHDAQPYLSDRVTGEAILAGLG